MLEAPRCLDQEAPDWHAHSLLGAGVMARWTPSARMAPDSQQPAPRTRARRHTNNQTSLRARGLKRGEKQLRTARAPSH